MDFWRFRAATQIYIIHKVAPRDYRYAIQIESLVFVGLVVVQQFQHLYTRQQICFARFSYRLVVRLSVRPSVRLCAAIKL